MLIGMGRGVGITEALHAAATWPVILLFGLVTQLGDVWFLFLLGVGLYLAGGALPRWGIDRPRGLSVFALALTYVALIGVLKPVFGLPRPPGAEEPLVVEWFPPLLRAVVDSITTAEGPGFPSGHALGSTMVWGGLALVLDWRSFRTRVVAASVVVGLISLSRLVLGVHYAIDVVVGIGFGVVALGMLYWLSEAGTDPGRILLVAAVVGILGLLTGLTFDSVAASGGAVGGWLVWRAVAETTPAHPASRRDVWAGLLVLVVVAGLVGALTVIEPPHPVTFVGSAVAVGAAVGAPLLGRRLA